MNRPAVSRSTMVFCGVLFAVWMTSLLLSAPHDLAVSIAMNDTASVWAAWMRDYGTMPSGALYISAIIYLFIPQLRCRSELLQKAAVTVLVMSLLDPLIITTLMKMLWGRLRFVQLHGDWNLFTPFYQINPGVSGVSFPSGHVATATVFFPVAWLLLKEHRVAAAALLAVVTATWGVAMAVARITIGAHYVTDTMFSFGLSLLLSPPVAWAGTKLWERYFRPYCGRPGARH